MRGPNRTWFDEFEFSCSVYLLVVSALTWRWSRQLPAGLGAIGADDRRAEIIARQDQDVGLLVGRLSCHRDERGAQRGDRSGEFRFQVRPFSLWLSQP